MPLSPFPPVFTWVVAMIMLIMPIGAAMFVFSLYNDGVEYSRASICSTFTPQASCWTELDATVTGTSTFVSRYDHGRTVYFHLTARPDQIDVPAPMDHAAGQLEPGATIVVRYWRGTAILIRTPHGQSLHGTRYPHPLSPAILIIGNLAWLPIVLITGVLAAAMAVDAWTVAKRNRSWFRAAGDGPLDTGFSWFVADRRRALVGIAGACAVMLVCYTAALIAYEWSRQWIAGLLVGDILAPVVAVLVFRRYLGEARANAATPTDVRR